MKEIIDQSEIVTYNTIEVPLLLGSIHLRVFFHYRICSSDGRDQLGKYLEEIAWLEGYFVCETAMV